MTARDLVLILLANAAFVAYEIWRLRREAKREMARESWMKAVREIDAILCCQGYVIQSVSPNNARWVHADLGPLTAWRELA